MRSRKRNLPFVIVTSWLLCASTALLTSLSASPALAEESGTDDTCVKCFNGDGSGGSCLSGRHYAEKTGTLHGPEHANTCQAGSCEDNHPRNSNCLESPSLAQLDSMVETAVHLRASDRGPALQRFGKRVSYNKGRESIQILGCRGDVVGNIPLRGERPVLANRVGH